MVGEVVVTAAAPGGRVAEAGDRRSSDPAIHSEVPDGPGRTAGDAAGEIRPAAAETGDDLPLIAGLLLAVMTLTFVVARGTARV